MIHGDLSIFLQLHQEQLLTSGVPQHFWETLHLKLKNEIFDSNTAFSLLKIDYEDEGKKPEDPFWIVQVTCEEGIKYNDSKHIYLIDHAWTFRLNTIKVQLLENDNLLCRLANMMGINTDAKEHYIDTVCEQIWKYCNTYTIGNAETAEARVPIWYIMDELGNGIQHSNTPNFRVVPFIYMPQGISYSLLFPICNVEFEDIVKRDFVEGTKDKARREALLVPWFPDEFKDVTIIQDEPDETYFMSSRMQETLPITQNYVILPEKIKVFTEYDIIRDYLNDPRFEFTDNEETADILWLTRHFKLYAELGHKPNRFVNQFPYEHVLTVKDLLSIICRRKGKDGLNPSWLPITYNLNTELDKFITLFRQHSKSKSDNHWICKPWNLARALDTYVTNNLDQIIRLTESGPKIVQKYIERPVTFYRPDCNGKVKFDVRYVILLKSVKPLQAYVYKNFFLRFSNKPFDLNDLDDYEKHFTVMNYKDDAELHHMKCADFILNWAEQYPDIEWKAIEKNMDNMLKEMFEAAVSKDPPRGICHSLQSRALYAADTMLSWDDTMSVMQPKLLEINWIPDCKRACLYYPDFYNKIFQLLFLNEFDEETFRQL